MSDENVCREKVEGKVLCLYVIQGGEAEQTSGRPSDTNGSDGKD
jgi:hypothetical protein